MPVYSVIRNPNIIKEANKGTWKLSICLEFGNISIQI